MAAPGYGAYTPEQLGQKLFKYIRGRNDYQVKKLLDAGANTGVVDTSGYTPLHVAVDMGDRYTVELLIAKGSNIEATEREGLTSLGLAAVKGNVSIVKVLLAAGANKDTVSKGGLTPMHYAAQYDHLNVIKKLLAAGANMEAVDDKGQTPLHHAAMYGNAATVELLIANGSDTDVKNIEGMSSLTLAVTSGMGQFSTVEILLASGANTDTVDNEGQTPLFHAATLRRSRIVKLLIEYGSNMEVKNINGLTSLNIAAYKGYNDIVHDLLAAGANKDTADNTGQTPLLYAVMKSRTDVVNTLLDAGVNVDVQNEFGTTPLMLAAAYGIKPFVERLLAAGADRNKRNNEGKTALELATENNHPLIVELFLPVQMWKGFSRADIEVLDSIFETEGTRVITSEGGVVIDPPRSINVSCCPICLKIAAPGRAAPFAITRSEACRYMSHNCSTSGGHYHEVLYNKYKNPEGLIYWCTVCGRICTGHRHHKLVSATEPKSGLIESGDPFGDEDKCLADGGGGVMEKLARWRRLREIAHQLQDKIDKISFKDAINGLIEKTWNAPLNRDDRLPQMMAAKKFTNISSENFPVYMNNSAVLDVAWPFQGRPALMPLVGPAEAGNTNVFTAEDLAIAIQLKHIKPNGEIELHEKIGIDSLFNGAYNTYAEPGTEGFGKCFMGCSGILYPGELQYILDKYNHPESLSDATRVEYQKKITFYKQRFNETCKFNPAFKARVDADFRVAAAMPAGGAGAAAGGAGAAAGGAGAAAAAGQGGGKRRTRRFRKQRRQSRHRKH
jgi:ankyrin repeat protein